MGTYGIDDSAVHEALANGLRLVEEEDHPVAIFGRNGLVVVLDAGEDHVLTVFPRAVRDERRRRGNRRASVAVRGRHVCRPFALVGPKKEVTW